VSHNNVLTITGPGTKIECTTSTFSGTAQNGNSSLTINPTYTGRINVTPHETPCSGSPGSLTIDMNGCDYDLTGSTTGSDSGTDATISITCPANTEIVVTTSSGLNLKIPAQTPTSGGVTYTNEAGKVKVTETSTGITYTCESPFLCSLSGIATEGNTADYNGSVVLAGAGGKRIEWSAS
jgi:hypothetical protein